MTLPDADAAITNSPLVAYAVTLGAKVIDVREDTELGAGTREADRKNKEWLGPTPEPMMISEGDTAALAENTVLVEGHLLQLYKKIDEAVTRIVLLEAENTMIRDALETERIGRRLDHEFLWRSLENFSFFLPVAAREVLHPNPPHLSPPWDGTTVLTESAE